MPSDLFVLVGYVAGVFGFIATMVAAVVIVRATAVQQTIKIQKGLIDTLLEKVDILEKSDSDNKLRIESMEKELEVVKTLPLAAIANTQAELLNDTKKIIELLEVKRK